MGTRGLKEETRMEQNENILRQTGKPARFSAFKQHSLFLLSLSLSLSLSHTLSLCNLM